MPTLCFAVDHALSQDEVIARLKNESDVLRGALDGHVRDIEEVWQDHGLQFRFTAFGMAVKGELRVEPNEVRTTAVVPLAAMLFKGTIEEKVRSRLVELLKP